MLMVMIGMMMVVICIFVICLPRHSLIRSSASAYPGLQEHRKLPIVFVQTLLITQAGPFSSFMLHSSMSVRKINNHVP